MGAGEFVPDLQCRFQVVTVNMSMHVMAKRVVFGLYRMMYELVVCSDGMTEAQPRSFRQNRPASEYII